MKRRTLSYDVVDTLKGIEEGFPIAVVLEDRLLLIDSGSHLADGAGAFDAERAGQKASMA